MKNLLIVIAVLFTLGGGLLSPSGQAKIGSHPDFSGIWRARITEEGDPFFESFISKSQAEDLKNHTAEHANNGVGTTDSIFTDR